MHPSISSQILNIKDADLNCHTAGAGGPAILLLHGAGADSALLSWGEVIPLLAGEYRVIAPDLPGYGLSARITGQYSLDFYTETIRGLIEYFGGPMIVAGLSLGGGIALNLALKYPRLVSILVPVDAWGLFSKLPWHRLTYHYTRSRINDRLYAWTGKYPWIIRWSLRANLFGDKALVTEDLMDQVMQGMRQPDAGRPFVSFQRSEITPRGLNTDLFGQLESIAMPVLLVHGSEDKAVPLRGAVTASRRIPDCELYIMRGCKHWPQKERPGEFAAALLDYLQRRR